MLRRYWDLAPQFRNKSRHPSEAAAAGALGALIVDSVRLRMIADVPVGAFLSGGRKDRARAVTMEGPLCDWVDPRAVERVSIEHLARRRDNGLKLFGLACLGLWLDELVAAPPIAGDMPAAGVA